MNRMRRCVWLLLLTAGSVAVMLSGKGGAVDAAEVETVAVTIGDVAEYAAVTGRIAYRDEQLVITPVSGQIEQVYVSVGDRVTAGEALVRLDADVWEQAVSAFMAASAALPEDALHEAALHQALEQSVLRAPVDGTVRQINVQGRGSVAAGTPAVLLSSSRQKIVCAAAVADAARIREGMWARITFRDEDFGIAWVKEVGAAEADNETGRVFHTIVLEPEEHIDLPAGASVEISVYLAGQMSVPVLPLQAITQKKTVWWVCDGRCTEIPAGIVLSDEMYAWVNLPEGLRVAIGEVKEGQLVAEVKH